jgi:hypothetical protein
MSNVSDTARRLVALAFHRSLVVQPTAVRHDGLSKASSQSRTRTIRLPRRTEGCTRRGRQRRQRGVGLEAQVWNGTLGGLDMDEGITSKQERPDRQ